jgi:phosphoglucomutase
MRALRSRQRVGCVRPGTPSPAAPSDHTNPLAGKPATAAQCIDVEKLVAAYDAERPDPTVAAQRVAFGTSGHRGSAFDVSFNAWHVLAITQAICDQRQRAGITGPLFMGIDTHALSAPACASALEVLAANGVDVMLASGDAFTPTPAVSHAIVEHNRQRDRGHADGIVVTPSHNPPRDGGFKYNPPHGGPAGDAVTGPIQAAANVYLEYGLLGVRRMPHARALRAATTHRHDYRAQYVAGLGSVLDLDAIRDAKLRMGVDPLGGAGVHYWGAIAERWRLDLTVVSEVVDPSFGFMTLDWDGQIRMDPASPYAMQRLIGLKDSFDIAFACDTDHDRHGIVTPTHGLLPPNHFLCVAMDHLFRHRPHWGAQAAVGKTVVSTALMHRVAARLGRPVFEVPVGFKWFASGLLDGSLGFAGEESAGASFLQRDGAVWTTDKDGITAALLAAEITAVTGRDPGALYDDLAAQLGRPWARLVEAAATPAQKLRLAALSPRQVTATDLAGERIDAILTQAPGNGAAIGGIKVCAASGWFAARPSGTEALYKIYAESFRDATHLQAIVQEAQAMVDLAIGPR